jgi:nicotinamidase-related amidase
MTRALMSVLVAVELTFALGVVPLVSPAHAQTIIDSWSTVRTPPAPALQPVSIDSRDTALLMLDFNASICNEAHRPSCVRSIAPVAGLLAKARAARMLVVYSTAGTALQPPPTPLAPLTGEPSVHAGVDKFLGTDLAKILADRGIKTVVVVGTSAQGAVLYTASEAALRGMSVVVPVDGYSADTPFAELYTAWHLKNAPASVSTRMSITRIDMITVK